MPYIQNNNPIKKREMTSLPDGTKIAKKRKGRQDLRSFNRSERKARVEAGYGTDVGNFFRRFNNPSANQSPPSTTNTNNTQTNYEDEKEDAKTKMFNTNYNTSLMDSNWKNKQFGGYGNLDHKSVALAKLKKNK
tara:strand:+ start:260 stop:661 length:402 start_codon:yes stop_codon:yes gene_type:complete